MILGSTVDTLNIIGFGCQLNRLQLFLREVEAQYSLRCPIIQFSLYKQLKDYETQLNGETTEQVNDEKIQGLETQEALNMDSIANQLSNSDSIQITQIVIVEGIEITIEYIRGKLNQAYTFINSRIIDLTGKIQGIVPDEISQWHSKDISIIEGRLQITKDKEIEAQEIGFENINHQLVHFVVQQDFKRVKPLITFIAENIQQSGQRWESLDELRKLQFETPQKLRASGINKLNIKMAEEKMFNTLNNLNEAEQIQYKYIGVRFVADDKETRENKGLEWVHELDKQRTVSLRVTVKGLEWAETMGEYKAIITIDPIKTKNGLRDKIKNISLRDIDRLGIIPGHEIEIDKNPNGSIRLHKY